LFRGRFSPLVYNYSAKLAPTRENCDDVLRRLKFTCYALGRSKASVVVATVQFSWLLKAKFN